MPTRSLAEQLHIGNIARCFTVNSRPTRNTCNTH